MESSRLFELRRRTFDTPHFRGIEFIEAEAKSIINRVPKGNLPFDWTLNPYRGCSHACAYCAPGDTPILMADGRTKPLADVRIGDEIYGTVREGSFRRYVRTRVLAHWSTVKPGFRISLADGRQLVASGDHRFLSDRGWRYVDGERRSPRPQLEEGSHLMGISDRRAAAVGSVPSRGVTVLDRTLVGDRVQAPPQLRVVSVEDLGVELPMYDITTGTGDFIANGVVSHNCFARVTHTYMDMNAGSDFSSKIVVKVNAPELLRRELRARRWRGEHIAMGTATDPYQRAEGRYRLMPPIIEVLTEHRNPFSILTKGTLILRDLEALAEAAQVTRVSTAFSIGTLDTEVWERSEPGTPHPRKRLEAVARLNEAGVPCGVMLAPVLPGISDAPKQLEAVVRGAVDAGATHVTPILLHLRPVVREEYMAWLRRAYPELVGSYEQMYRASSYAPRRERDALGSRVADLVAAAGGVRPRAAVAERFGGWRDRDRPGPQKPSTEQLPLL